jgi:transposase
MLKTFQYRLYPTKRQERLLTEQGEEVRWLWNTLLAERTIAWEERPEAVLYYDQQNALPTLKTTLRPPLALPSPSPRSSPLPRCARCHPPFAEGAGRLLPSPESGSDPRIPTRPGEGAV